MTWRHRHPTRPDFDHHVSHLFLNSIHFSSRTMAEWEIIKKIKIKYSIRSEAKCNINGG
jgi:hypothetical protein